EGKIPGHPSLSRLERNPDTENQHRQKQADPAASSRSAHTDKFADFFPNHRDHVIGHGQSPPPGSGRRLPSSALPCGFLRSPPPPPRGRKPAERRRTAAEIRPPVVRCPRPPNKFPAAR